MSKKTPKTISELSAGNSIAEIMDAIDIKIMSMEEGIKEKEKEMIVIQNFFDKLLFLCEKKRKNKESLLFTEEDLDIFIDKNNCYELPSFMVEEYDFFNNKDFTLLHMVNETLTYMHRFIDAEMVYLLRDKIKRFLENLSEHIDKKNGTIDYLLGRKINPKSNLAKNKLSSESECCINLSGYVTLYDELCFNFTDEFVIPKTETNIVMDLFSDGLHNVSFDKKDKNDNSGLELAIINFCYKKATINIDELKIKSTIEVLHKTMQDRINEEGKLLGLSRAFGFGPGTDEFVRKVLSSVDYMLGRSVCYKYIETYGADMLSKQLKNRLATLYSDLEKKEIAKLIKSGIDAIVGATTEK